MDEEENSYDVITQNELDEIIKKHKDFLTGRLGGARAVVKFKNLTGLDFKESDLSQSDFSGSILVKANLSNCNFNGASFFSSDLRHANLEYTDLTRADMRGAFVVGANLSHAKLENADLRQGKIMQQNKQGVLEDKPNPFGDNSFLHNAVFSGARMTKSNLTGVRATAADFSDSDLSGVSQ